MQKKNQVHGWTRNVIGMYHDRNIASRAPKVSGGKLGSIFCWKVQGLWTHVTKCTDATIALEESQTDVGKEVWPEGSPIVLLEDTNQLSKSQREEDVYDAANSQQ